MELPQEPWFKESPLPVDNKAAAKNRFLGQPSCVAESLGSVLHAASDSHAENTVPFVGVVGDTGKTVMVADDR